MEPLSFVNCSVSPPLASFFEAVIVPVCACMRVYACVCVRVPSVTIQHLISGSDGQPGFPCLSSRRGRMFLAAMPVQLPDGAGESGELSLSARPPPGR